MTPKFSVAIQVAHNLQCNSHSFCFRFFLCFSLLSPVSVIPLMPHFTVSKHLDVCLQEYLAEIL